MKLQVEIPDSIAVQMQELASRERVSMDNLVATALTAQLDKSPKRPTITEKLMQFWLVFPTIPRRCRRISGSAEKKE